MAGDVGEATGNEWDEWDAGGEWTSVGAVFPSTQCYACGGFGHMARECPAKGKSKGKGKDGGKTMGKGVWGKGKAKGGVKGSVGPGGGKQGGKGGVGGKGKGEGKAGGKGWFGKGFYGGYQGVCHNCGIVGHKAAECGVYAVGSVNAEDAAGCEAGAQEMPMGGVSSTDTGLQYVLVFLF